MSYIDNNYDPVDFATFNDFIDKVTSDWQTSSNNPDVIFRSDIQEGLESIYESTFGLQEPETFEELIEEFTEPPDFEEREAVQAPEETIKEAKSILSEIKSLFRKLFR